MPPRDISTRLFVISSFRRCLGTKLVPAFSYNFHPVGTAHPKPQLPFRSLDPNKGKPMILSTEVKDVKDARYVMETKESKDAKYKI